MVGLTPLPGTSTVELPEGQPIQYGDLPRLIASALHQEGFGRAFAEINLKSELEAMVRSGELTVCDPLTLAPHPFPLGEQLRRAVLRLREDLGPLLASRGIGLRLIAGAAPKQGTAGPTGKAYGKVVNVGGRKEVVAARYRAGAADWSLWQHAMKAELWRVIALSLNAEPGDWADVFGSGLSAEVANDLYPSDYWRRLDIARARLDEDLPALGPAPSSPDGDVRREVRLRDFRDLAERLDWQLPAEFPRAGAAGDADARRQRQDDRLKAYRANGFTPPKKHGDRWTGVGKVAQRFGIKRQSLTEDLKAAYEREQEKARAGAALGVNNLPSRLPSRR